MTTCIHRRIAGVLTVGIATLTVGLAACEPEPAAGGRVSTSGPKLGADGGPGGSTTADGAGSPPGDPGSPSGPTLGDAGTSPSNGSDKPSCKYEPHKTGQSQHQQTGGLSYTVYAPPGYDPKIGHAVVVLMHGQDSDGTNELAALWKPIADEDKLVLIAPKGSRPPTSSANPNGANWLTSDLDKVLDVMTEVDDCYNVLTKKHLLWGFSEGGFYGYLLGLVAADRFSGLAMAGANTSFARQYDARVIATAPWKIPVSHVHGATDFNPIAFTYQDRDDLQGAGHVFTLHEHPGGHTIDLAKVRTQYADLKASLSP